VAISDDAAIVNQDCPFGEGGGEVHIAGCDYQSLGQSLEEFNEAFSVSWVEAAVGFVEGDYFGRHREYSSDSGGSFLTGREMMRCFIGHFEQADGLQSLSDPGFDGFRFQAHIKGAEGNIVEEGRHKQLVIGVLEAAANGSTNFFHILFTNRQAVDIDVSGAFDEAGQGEKQSGFTGAIGAYECYLSAVLDGKSNVTECDSTIGVHV